MNENALTGSIFYLIHDMIIKAGLFLLVGLMATITGTNNLKQMGGLIKNYPGFSWTFFLAALALAGIPPLSGFVGKVLIVQGGFSSEHFIGAAIVLASSLFVLISIMKIFINGIWGEPKTFANEKTVPYKQLLIAPVILVILSICYGVGADFVYPYISQAAESLINTNLYIDAVLKE